MRSDTHSKYLNTGLGILLSSLLGIVATDAAAAGYFYSYPWGNNILEGFASIDEAARAGCSGSQKPYHYDPSITCDGSTTTHYYPGQTISYPPSNGWLPINFAYYYPGGNIAAGGPIGYLSTAPEVKNASPCGNVGNPVNPATGIKRQCEDPDIGEGMLQYKRTYLSATPLLRRVTGVRWHATFSQRISLGITTNWSMAMIRRADGQIFSFTRTSPSTDWVGDADINYKLATLTPSNGYSLTTPDQTVETYDSNGLLLSVARPDGRAALLTYSASPPAGEDPKLLTVTDDFGRSLTFTYYPSNAPTGAGNVATITDSAGQVVTYGYDAKDNLTSVTFHDGTVRTYVYNEQNLTQNVSLPHALTGIVDENGDRYASYGYNYSGRVVSTEHAGAVQKFQFNYVSPGSSTVVTDPFGVAHNFYFQTDHGVRRPTIITPKCTTCGYGATVNMAYDLNGNRTSETDANGNQITYTFDTARNLETQRIEAANDTTGKKRTIQTDWHPTFRSPSERRVLDFAGALKAKTAWTYNSRNQVSTITATDPSVTPNVTRTTTYTYCEQSDVTAGTCPLLGLLKTVDGPRTDVSDITTYTYHQSDAPGCIPGVNPCAHRKGDLHSVTNALDQAVYYSSYDDAGRPTAVSDTDGVTTNFEYDARGRITARKVRGTDGAVETDDQITRIEYWPTGLVKKVTQPDGAFTSYTYDAAHRLTGIADNAGNSITYTLNAVGERTQEDTKDSTGTLMRTLSRTYNTLGQLQTATDAYNRNIGFTYDANGNLDQVTDALTRVADNNYDPLDRLSRTLQDMNGIAAETKFAYDALDNLTQVNDPKGLNTNYSYNGFSELTSLQSPDTGTTTYTYDAAGNRASQTDARSKVTNYGYDALNRLIAITYPTANALNATYTYDATQTDCLASETFSKGRLTKIVDQSGTTVYCYDRFGQLVRKKQTVNAKVFTLRYVYLTNGRLDKIVYPDLSEARYLYDTQGRPKEVNVSTATGTVVQVLRDATYYPFGPVNQWIYGNGRLMRRSLNQNYQPGFVEVTGGTGISIGYEFDEVGNLKKLRAATQTDPPQRIYTYDGLNRLTENRNGSTNALLHGYAYDKTGNRTSATVGASTTTYTYPATNHRLGQVGANVRAYDNNGNTTQIPGTTTKNFVYGDNNRMIQVLNGTTVAMNYVHNGKGELVRKYVGTTNTYSLYDEAGHWLGDYNNSGVPTQQVIWFGDLPVGVLVGATTAQKLHYVEADALGTPRAVIDPTRGTQGIAVWTWNLNGEAFGTTAPSQNPDGDATSFVFNMRFPGQRYDSASGLNYNYFRDYEPGTGRYSQSDPIGLGGGASTYGYVGGAPLDSSDSLGLFVDSVRWTCLRDPTFCAELLGDLSQGQADLQRRLGNDCLAQYYDAAADLANSFAPFLENLSLARDVGRSIGNALGDISRNPRSYDPYLGFADKTRKKPGSLGQSKGTDALRRENRTARDAARAAGLDKDQRRLLHDEISGQDLSYEEILEIARLIRNGQI